MLKHLAAAALTLCTCAPVSAMQPASKPTMVSSKDLKEDLAVLRRAYSQLHPGLTRYNTQADLDRLFGELDTAFSKDQTRAEAFLALSRFTAAIRCGHTFPNPSNQPKTVAAELFGGKNKLPYHFRWLNRRMIVTRDLSGGTLPPGTEVVEVNGNAAESILQTLLPYARADGSNDAKRISLLELRGSDRLETFDIYFPLLFPPAFIDFSLKVRRPDSPAAETLTVRAMTADERYAAMAHSEPSETEPLWTLSYLDERTAYLPMPSWVAYKTKWDWKAFIHRSFDEIIERRCDRLIIDLRGNEGGSSVGDVILTRLIERDLPLTSYKQYTRYRKTPEDLNTFLDTWDDSFRDWGAAATEQANGLYRMTKFEDGDGDTIKPVGKRFDGKTIVLVDSNNSSATFEFASIVKQHRLATLIGQPTGGNQRGINGDAFFFLRLPHSKLEVDLPLVAQFPNRPMPDAGIEPDVLIEPTPESIAKGLDIELEAARDFREWPQRQ